MLTYEFDIENASGTDLTGVVHSNAIGENSISNGDGTCALTARSRASKTKGALGPQQGNNAHETVDSPGPSLLARSTTARSR